MNYNQRFDEHIQEQFLNYTPQVHPRIWENIAREREKKRPAGFWLRFFNRRNLFILGGLLLAAGGGAYLYSSKQVQVNQPAAPSITHNVTTGSKASANEDPAANNNETGNTTSTSVNEPAATNSHTIDNTADNSGIPGESFTKQPAGDVKQPRIAGSSVNNTGDNNRRSDVVLFSQGDAKKYNTAARQRTRIQNGTAVTEPEPATSEPIAAEINHLSFLLFTAQKNSSTKKENKLRKPVFFIADPGCPSIEKNAAGNKTYFEIYGGPDYAFRNMSDTGNSAYLQKRKESTRFASAFSAGLRYTRVFSNGISFRTGINYSQINEKFTYSEGNIVQVVYIINNAGDTIGSYMTSGTRYKTTQNKFRTIDVPLVLGYELGNGRLHTNINAGVIVNAYSWQKGEVLDSNYKPVTITTGKSNSAYQFKTNIGVGFIGSVSVYYKLNDRWHILAEPYFRYNLTPASKETITFKQKYNTAGIRVGLRYDLK
ncbi:MAG: hypothetical protein U0V75_02955 [Ferruginibacter sp.]